MVAELTKRLDNSTNQSRKDKDQSKYQHQPNPSTKTDHLYESFLSLQSFKEKGGIHIFYQPLTVYEGDSYNYGNGPSEIMIKPNTNPKSAMILVQTEIDNCLENNEARDLPTLTWIRLFKTLFKKLEGVMNQIIRYMSSSIKVQRYNEEDETEEVWINGEDVRHYLTSIKENSHEDLIAMEMSMTYADVWDAVSTTFIMKLTLINSQTYE